MAKFLRVSFSQNTSEHHCFNYLEERLDVLNSIKNIDISILQQSDSEYTSFLLFDNTSFNNNKKTFVLDFTIDYFILTGIAFPSITRQMKTLFSIGTNFSLRTNYSHILIFFIRFILFYIYLYYIYIYPFIYIIYNYIYIYIHIHIYIIYTHAKDSLK